MGWGRGERKEVKRWKEGGQGLDPSLINTHDITPSNTKTTMFSDKPGHFEGLVVIYAT